MSALLMAIFAWFASLVTAAEQPRAKATVRPAATVAKAPATLLAAPAVKPIAASNASTPGGHYAFEFAPVAVDNAKLCDAMVCLQDGRATMSEALSELQTFRISSAAGRCDRTVIIRNARLRAPVAPTLPPPLSSVSRNS